MNIIIGEGIINIKRYVIYYKWILKLYLKDPRIKVASKFERIVLHIIIDDVINILVLKK